MMKKNTKLSAGVKFLLLVLFIYVFAYLLTPYLVISAMISSFSMFLKIIPILIFVFILNLLINHFVNDELLAKYLGEKSGWQGYFYSILAGVLIGGPPYILLPMLGNLQKRGVSNSLLGTFLFNRNVKIPFFPVMIYYFGLSYTIIVSIMIVVFSIPMGFLLGKALKQTARRGQ